MKGKAALVMVLSLLLVICVPVAPAAPSAAAKMITAGKAKLNGAEVPALTSAFPGDRIATEQKSTTTLSFPGGDAVVIPEMSKVVLGKVGGHPLVNLVEGTLSVLTKRGAPLTVIAHGARITAVNGAVYGVALRGNSLRVATRSGEARVETANRSGNIEAGHALTATMAPQTVQGVKPGNTLLSSNTWVVGLIAAGAATGLGVGIYEAEKGNSASPSAP